MLNSNRNVKDLWRLDPPPAGPESGGLRLAAAAVFLPAREGLLSGLDQLERCAGARVVLRLEFPAAQLVVIDEEFLDLIQQMRPQILDRFDAVMRLGVAGNREQPI